jgi:uncharacterized protein (DUF1501 family)
MTCYSRRRFLQHSAVVGIAAATQMNTLGRIAHAAGGNDYKALVCILLGGGADSFNMLVPYDAARYADYVGFRSDLALAHADLLPLAYTGAGGATFAVHPGLGAVQTLFDQGDLAFIANVGTLAEPTDKTAFEQGTVRLPLGLFSHADQIAQWQTSVPDRRIATGVAGRIADIVAGANPPTPISMNISLSGTNVFQTGASVSDYALDATDGVRLLAGYGQAGSEVFTNAVDAMLASSYSDPFRRTYATKLRNAIDSGATFKAMLDAAPTLSTSFSATPLSRSLAAIARVISVRGDLSANRHTFFVSLGGWDHHDNVLTLQAQMLPGVAAALSEFQQALVELGVADAVTTFTISDFGRTLTSNGKGSDHGWGGHQLVMGGAVAGKRVYGEYPVLIPDNALDVGRGRYIPTTSVDAFYAELALWFGIAPSELDLVLPNIRRFYSPESMTPPIGFMA